MRTSVFPSPLQVKEILIDDIGIIIVHPFLNIGIPHFTHQKSHN